MNFILKYDTEVLKQESILVLLDSLKYMNPILLVDLEAGDFLDQVPGSTQLILVSQIIQIKQIINAGYI